ncbi:MAG: hypothetical protein GX848_04480 [Clostridiales bacterium]|nr:hypothetical protein [Clostridiales bacterium]
MKKTIFFTVILFICFSLVFTAFAASLNDSQYDSSLPRVIDKADILTNSEEKKLNELIENIMSDYLFDVVILTVNSIGNKTVQEFADDYYDYNHYGYGENSDGILFMLNMGERDYYTCTTGKGIDVFTDYSIELIHGQVISYLSSGQYFQAFRQYIILVSELLKEEQAGGIIYDYDKPFDSNFIEILPKINTSVLPAKEVIFVSILIGFFISFASVSVMNKKMKTAVFKKSAKDYVEAGTFVLTKESDRFLFRTTTRVKIENDTTNTGSKSGGSSVHTGSSGTSHGGGGGKF